MSTVTTTQSKDGVTTYNSSAASLLNKSSSSVPQDTLDQDDFLKLLTAQLQAQDPLNPVSNADLVAQMATITTTSGIAQMGDTLAGISSTVNSLAQSLTTSSSRFGDAANWIGHNMLVKNDYAGPSTSGAYSGQFALAQDSDAVAVNLVDNEGNVVKSIDLGAQKAGEVSFSWDGRDADGAYVGGGTYKVEVSGGTASGTATWAAIAAVQSPADSSSSKLITPIGSFSPKDALSLI